jgi:hypothetical protein
MHDNTPQTPLQEAISLITIAAILVALGCYIAALKNVPVLSSCLFWVAVQVYHLFPLLNKLPGQQLPMLVSAAAVGFVIFVCAIPFAHLLAQAFSRAGIQGIERQTRTLKKQRERLKNKKRDRNDFLAS